MRVSKTQQHFQQECDVNHIIAKFNRTGILGDPFKASVPVYRDVSEVPDFMAMNNHLIKAKEAFMSLPAKLRRQFGDDPIEFLQFVHDPANKDKLVELGLAKKPEPEQPDYVKLQYEELQKLNKSKETAHEPT